MSIPETIRQEALRLASEGKQASDILRYFLSVKGYLPRPAAIYYMTTIFEIRSGFAFMQSGWTGYGDGQGSLGDREIDDAFRVHLDRFVRVKQDSQS